MRARQCMGIVGAQPGVGPITALSVAARIAKQRLDLLDPLPIPAWLRRRRRVLRRCNTVEPLACLECGVLHLDIAPIACGIGAQQFIGARDARAVLVRARRLYHRCGAVVVDGPVEIEDAVALFIETGLTTVFINLEGWPGDWTTNLQAVLKFFRDHQCPSFLEYGEYPYVSADEIKKALALKQAFSSMLDQMQ